MTAASVVVSRALVKIEKRVTLLRCKEEGHFDLFR